MVSQWHPGLKVAGRRASACVLPPRFTGVVVAILVVGRTIVCAYGRHGWAGSGLAPRGESGLVIKIRRVVHSLLSTARKTDKR